MVDVVDGDLERLDFAQTFVAVLIRYVTSRPREAVVDGLNATSLACVPETNAMLGCALQDSTFSYMCVILNDSTSPWHQYPHRFTSGS